LCHTFPPCLWADPICPPKPSVAPFFCAISSRNSSASYLESQLIAALPFFHEGFPPPPLPPRLLFRLSPGVESPSPMGVLYLFFFPLLARCFALMSLQGTTIGWLIFLYFLPGPGPGPVDWPLSLSGSPNFGISSPPDGSHGGNFFPLHTN